MINNDFYRKYNSLVESICREWARSEEDYTNLVSDSWIHLLEWQDRYDPERSKKSTWVYALVFSVCWGRYNNSKPSPDIVYESELSRKTSSHADNYDAYEEEHSNDGSWIEQHAVNYDDPYEELSRSLSVDLLEDIHRYLTLNEFDIYNCVVDQGLTQQETADKLEVTRYYVSETMKKVFGLLKDSME